MSEWLFEILHVESWGEFWWVVVGLGGQLMFTARFLVQWIASERAGLAFAKVARLQVCTEHVARSARVLNHARLAPHRAGRHPFTSSKETPHVQDQMCNRPGRWRRSRAQA